MQFYSTNSPDVKVGLKEAVLKGLASDKGLFMPEVIPHLDASFFDDIHNSRYVPKLQCPTKDRDHTYTVIWRCSRLYLIKV